jgi:hypothetical protein
MRQGNSAVLAQLSDGSSSRICIEVPRAEAAGEPCSPGRRWTKAPPALGRCSHRRITPLPNQRQPGLPATASENLPLCANSPLQSVLNNRGVAREPQFEPWHRKCKVTSVNNALTVGGGVSLGAGKTAGPRHPATILCNGSREREKGEAGRAVPK